MKLKTLAPWSKSYDKLLFRLVVQLCLTLYNPMNYSTPGLPVHHQLPEFTQTQVHQVGDAIQPSHPVIPFSSCLQSFPESQSFPMSQFFTSGGQSIRVSASASVLPMNIQGWFPLGLTGLISLLSKGLSKVLSSTTIRKHQFFSAQPSVWSNSHIRTWLLEKSELWLDGSLLAKWTLCFLICCLGLSSLSFQGASFDFMAAVTMCSDFGAQENKICHWSHFFPSICHEMMGQEAMILVLLILSLTPDFSRSFTIIKKL